MDLATRIRTARKHTGLSQERMAAGVGVTRSAVTNWEISARSNPCTAHLEAVARITSVSFEWLATGRGSMLLHDGPDNVLPFGEIIRDTRERRLLRAYRKTPEDLRLAILSMVESPDFLASPA